MSGAAKQDRAGAADTLDSVPGSLSLRDGFAWWLPLLTAAAAVLIAVGIAQSSAEAWDADVHLWAREGASAAEYAELLLDRSVQEAMQEQTANSMMTTEHGPPVLSGVAVDLTDTLIRLTVRAPRQADAEALAVWLADAAVSESVARYGDAAGLETLGLVHPGARQVAPATEWAAAGAAAIGLAGGLALAWLTARPTRLPGSTLGRLGRIGLRPLAVISVEAERAAARTGTHTARQRSEAAPTSSAGSAAGESAALLANAIAAQTGVVALTPLDDGSGVTAVLVQTARALAASGRSVIWLDSRRPAFALRYGPVPGWLAGAPWFPVARSTLILRRAVGAGRAGSCVLVLTDPLSDPDAAAVANGAAGVILLARADAAEAQLLEARRRLSRARLLGVALTQAQAPELRDFELAQMAE